MPKDVFTKINLLSTVVRKSRLTKKSTVYVQTKLYTINITCIGEIWKIFDKWRAEINHEQRSTFNRHLLDK